MPSVTGLTANDADGTVTLFATSSGSNGTAGTLYEITDASGLGGTLTGNGQRDRHCAANEAFRGVAFAPGTTIGSGRSVRRRPRRHRRRRSRPLDSDLPARSATRRTRRWR